MISLKRSVERYDTLQGTVDAALSCLRSALLALEEDVLPVCAGTPEPFAETLRQIRATLSAHPTSDALTSAERNLVQVMRQLNLSATDQFRDRLAEVGKIVELLARACEHLNDRTNRYSTRFRAFADSLDQVCRLKTLDELRRAVAEETGQLRECVEDMQQNDNQVLAQLTVELTECRERMEAAELAVLTDPVTSAGNRRALESEVRARIEAEREFSLMLFDIDNYAGIRAKFGILSSDPLSREFAARLSARVNAGEPVFRWGAHEFMVLTASPVSEALGRARQIAMALGGRYTVASDGRELKAEVKVSTGVAEYRRGERVDQILARADALVQHRRYECAG